MKNHRSSISISVRRHFVDEFYMRHSHLMEEKKVIDIGGKKINKRGFFNAEDFSDSVTYINIEEKDKPDIIADAASIPLEDSSFDIVIMGEVLEHLPDPKAALKEAYRLLKPGGHLIATVPFMVGIHADPFDYGRYTEFFWRKAAEEIDFSVEKIEPQGTIFAVEALMIQHFFRSRNISWRPIQNLLIFILMRLDRRTSHPLLTAWTTGYGLILFKS